MATTPHPIDSPTSQRCKCGSPIKPEDWVRGHCKACGLIILVKV